MKKINPIELIEKSKEEKEKELIQESLNFIKKEISEKENEIREKRAVIYSNIEYFESIYKLGGGIYEEIMMTQAELPITYKGYVIKIFC